MAKARAICKCEKCGEEFARVKDCVSRKQADQWEEWAVGAFTLCGNCYHEKQMEKEKEKGLYFDVALDGACAMMGDENCVAVIFGGDTMPYKDSIKGIGAYWTDDYPSDGVFASMVTMSSPGRRWVIRCKLEEYEDVAKKAESIGAKPNNMPTSADVILFREMKNHREERIAQRDKEIAETIGEIPQWDESVSKIFKTGLKWNGKVYGKAGKYSIYLSGEQTTISDAQKELIEKTYAERQEWKNKKAEIMAKYRI